MLGPPNALTEHPLDKEGPTWAPPQPAEGSKDLDFGVGAPRPVRHLEDISLGVVSTLMITQSPSHPEQHVSHTQEVTEQHMLDEREQAGSRQAPRPAGTLGLAAPQHER